MAGVRRSVAGCASSDGRALHLLRQPGWTRLVRVREPVRDRCKRGRPKYSRPPLASRTVRATGHADRRRLVVGGLVCYGSSRVRTPAPMRRSAAQAWPRWSSSVRGFLVVGPLFSTPPRAPHHFPEFGMLVGQQLVDGGGTTSARPQRLDVPEILGEGRALLRRNPSLSARCAEFFKRRQVRRPGPATGPKNRSSSCVSARCSGGFRAGEHSLAHHGDHLARTEE